MVKVEYGVSSCYLFILREFLLYIFSIIGMVLKAMQLSINRLIKNCNSNLFMDEYIRCMKDFLCNIFDPIIDKVKP